MKYDFPILPAKSSIFVATPLIYLVALVYALKAVSRPASEVYSIGITAFGITAALSGICLTVSELIKGSANFRYSGEKFLHSAILLVQTLILIYLNDFLAKTWLHNYYWLYTTIETVIRCLVIILSLYAAITWFHGFHSVNLQLWHNWEWRADKNNKENSVKENKEVSNSVKRNGRKDLS